VSEEHHLIREPVERRAHRIAAPGQPRGEGPAKPPDAGRDERGECASFSVS
jgi:hypothetical protein